MNPIYSQLIRETGSFQVQDSALFIAQLYCWAKLSDQYPEEVTPNFFDVASSTESYPEFQSKLKELQELELSESTLDELKALNSETRSLKSLIQFESRLRALRFNPIFLQEEGFDWKNVLSGIKHDVTSNLNCYESVATDLIEILAQKGSAFQYTLPDELLSTIVSLGELKEETTVICKGEISLPLALKASEKNCNVTNATFLPTGTGSLRIPYHVVNLLLGAPIQIENFPTPMACHHTDNQYDVGFSALPFGLKGRLADRFWSQILDIDSKPSMPARNAEQQELTELIASSTERAIALAPESFLYATIGDQVAYRKDLVQSGHLRAVISLPSGILGETSIKTALIVIDKKEKQDTVQFIDASGSDFYKLAAASRHRFGGRNVLIGCEKIVDWFLNPSNANSQFCKQVTLDTIAENNHDLMTPLYVVNDEVDQMQRKLASMDTIPLSDICDVISVTPLKARAESESEHFNEVRIGDISEQGVIREELGQIVIESKKLPTAQKLMLRHNDVLLSVKGAIGTVALVNSIQHEGALPSQTLCIIRVKAGIDSHTPLELFRYLKSPIAQLWLSQRAKGSNVRSISIKELKELPVPKLSPQEKVNIVSVHKEIEQLTEQIDALTQKRTAAQKSLWSIES